MRRHFSARDGRGRRQRFQQILSLRRAETSASVPARAGGVRAVVAGRDVLEHAVLAFRVERGIYEAAACVQALIQACNERRPKRGCSADASDRFELLAIDVHDHDAAVRIGVGGDVGDAAADLVWRID